MKQLGNSLIFMTLLIVFTGIYPICAGERSDQIQKLQKELTVKDSDDLRVQLAYALLHSEAYGEAEKEFMIVLQRNKGYWDAAKGLASVYAFQKQYSRAAEFILGFREGEHRDEALMLAAKYYAWGGYNWTSRYHEAASMLPDTEKRTILPKQAVIARLDAGYAFTLLFNDPNNWNYGYMHFTAYPLDMLSFEIYQEDYDRFSLFDDLYGGAITFKPLEEIALRVDYYRTRAADFLATQRVWAELTIKPYRPLPLIFMFGYFFYDYDELDTHMITAAVEYYFPKGFLAGYRYYHVFHDRDTQAGAHMLYGGYIKEAFVKLLFGIAMGNEFISDERALRDRTDFAVSPFIRSEWHTPSPFLLLFNVQYSWVRDAADRLEFGMGIGYEF